MIRAVLGSIRRRWYIALPGVVAAGLLAVGAWLAIPPTFERSASQFLVPPPALVSESTSPNPYLYLGGLTAAADVLVRAVGSENVDAEIRATYGDVDVQVGRDPTTAGPVILITVNAGTDAQAAEVLEMLLDRTRAELHSLQLDDVVSDSQRITVQPITIDQQGTQRQRTRLVSAAFVGGSAFVLTVVLAVGVDGLMRNRHRRDGP